MVKGLPFSQNLLTGAVTVLIVGAASSPLLAWKSRTAHFLGSPHIYQADRALELLAARFPANQLEWNRLVDQLPAGCGSLDNDSNAHGNVLYTLEKVDPEGRPSSDPEPMAFNGGPMFRWWIRALEAHGQANAALPARDGTPRSHWRRIDTVRSVQDVYKYLGFMVHLVQDNCAPAHMANIRHAYWDGAEWWHFSEWSSGGGGADKPESLARIQELVQAQGGDGFWDVTQLREYWKKDRERESIGNAGLETSPHKGSGTWRNPLFQSISGILDTRVVQWNRNWLMPGLANELRVGGYFRSFNDPTGTGHVLSESQIRDIHASDHAVVERTQLPDGSTTEIERFERRLDAHPVMQQLLERGQISFQDRLPSVFSLLVAGSPWELSTDVEAKWVKLNKQKTPWLPHPGYQGEAWDARWGSYGGHFGFPGRKPYEQTMEEGGLEDGVSVDKGRITPGDLYTWHLPGHGYSYDHEKQEPVFGFNNDERSFRSVLPLPRANNRSIADLGQQLLNRAALMTAVMVDGFSRALPPLVERLIVVPRAGGEPPSDPELPGAAKAVPWCSPGVGAWIDLTLGLNRPDGPRENPAAAPYYLEFYAIPRKLMENPPPRPGIPPDPAADGSTFVKKLVLTKPGLVPNSFDGNGVLWKSDIILSERIANWNTPQDTPTPVMNFAAVDRDYDFYYFHQFGYPLRLRSGVQGVQTNNLNTPTADSFIGPWAVPRTNFLTFAPLTNRYVWQVSARFEWTGEVEDPKYLFPEVAGSSPDAASLPADPMPTIEGKKVLPSGDYFILVMAYRNGWRDAFARNQFKIMTPSKEVLEKGKWWSLPWTEANLETFRNAAAPPSPSRMIPDELVPIRVEGGRPTVTVQ